jgi:hypothetical protein
MCLSTTEDNNPFVWKQAHLPRAGENVQRAMYHGLILALATALQQGFSEVFVLGYNEIMTKQVCTWALYSPSVAQCSALRTFMLIVRIQSSDAVLIVSQNLPEQCVSCAHSVSHPFKPVEIAQ